MLGKIFKYEFRSFSKTLLPLTIFFAVFSIIGFFAFRNYDTIHLDNSSVVYLIFITILIPVYVISCFVSIIISFLYGPVRFSKSMFTNEGYLLRMIPVKTTYHILSKLMAGFIWFIISAICFIVLFSMPFFADEYLSSMIKYLFNGLSLSEISFGLLRLIIGFIYGQIALFLSITLSNIFFRKLRSFGLIMFMIAEQIVYSIILGLSLDIVRLFTDFASYSSVYNTVQAIVQLLLSIPLFFITCKLIDKKAELE